MTTRRSRSVWAACQQDQRKALEAMRDKLAADMDIAEPAVVAQIAGRLQAVLERLADLSKTDEVTLDDVLARRREARAAAADPSTHPAGGGVHQGG